MPHERAAWQREMAVTSDAPLPRRGVEVETRGLTDGRHQAIGSGTVYAGAPSSEPAPSTGDVLPRGSTIGRFVVVDLLGTGAMGVVYKAYDPMLGREVALKLLQARIFGREVEARLIREARAMAKVSHPNVVAIHEVSLEGEQVTLAMEYVPGHTLWRWTQERRRDWRDIVQVFAKAGQGLAAAHRAGLVHRDFKPANVLVSEDGRVLVTDFGIATSLGDARGTDPPPDASAELRHHEIRLTRADAVVGTPWYMAPEQHRGAEVDPRTDQYAFCLALWEALCGHAPFADAPDLVLAKFEGPPAWPKQVVVPRPIVQAIMRGLAPIPDARFANMESLLEQLAHDPARRRRQWWTGGVAVPGATLAGAWLYTWHAERAALCSGAEEHLRDVWDEHRRAEVERALLKTGITYAPETSARVTRLFDDHARRWAAAFQDACEATTLRAEQSQEVMDLRMACLHRVKIEVGSAVNVLASADAAVVEHAVEIASGLSSPTRCEDVHALTSEAPPIALRAQVSVVEQARALMAEAHALSVAAKHDEAMERLTAAAATLGTIDYAPVLAEIAESRAHIEAHQGHHAVAEESFREALRLALRTGAQSLVGSIAASLAAHLAVAQSRPSEAQWLAELALGVALQRRDERAEADARSGLSIVLDAQGKFHEAEAEARRALVQRERVLGPDHFVTAQLRSHLAALSQDQGRFLEAEAEHRQILALRERIFGSGHPSVAESCNNLAIALALLGRHSEAEAQLRRAVEIYEQALGADHPLLAEPHSNLASVLLLEGRAAEAETVYRKALESAENRLGPAHRTVAQLRGNLGGALMEQGHYQAAEQELERALEIAESTLGLDHPSLAEILMNLGLAARELERLPQAVRHFRRALSLRERAFSADHPKIAQSQISLATALVRMGEAATARPLLEHVVMSHASGPPHEQAEAAFALAMLVADEDEPRALELARAAVKGFADAGERWHEEQACVQRWLDQNR